MAEKVSEMLKNDCLWLVANIKKLDEIHWNGNTCILIDVLG